MDTEDLREKIVQEMGAAFLRGMLYKNDDNGSWTCPIDAYDALEHRKEIMRDYGWDTDLIEKRNPGLLGSKNLWEETEYAIECSFNFGEYPEVPKWVETFGTLVGDCSKQTVFSVDNELLFGSIFENLFSEEPEDLLQVLQIMDLTAPAVNL